MAARQHLYLTLLCLVVVAVLLEEVLPSFFLFSSFLLPSLPCSSSRSSEDLQAHETERERERERENERGRRRQGSEGNQKEGVGGKGMGIKGFGREMRRREGEESGSECEVGEGRGALCSILLMFTGQYQKSQSSCETSHAV